MSNVVSGQSAGLAARASKILPGAAHDRPDVPAAFIGCVGTISLHASDGLDAISDIWRAFQVTAWHTPFQDIDWVTAWYEAAGRFNGHQPFVVLGYEDGELRLILPLAVTGGGGLSKLCWLGQSANDYNAPVIDAEFAERCRRDLAEDIWTVVVDACVPIDLIEFAQQPEHIAGRANAFIHRAAMPSSCSAHLVNLEPGWAEFYARLRGSKSRKRLREKFNKLARLGRLQFRGEKDPAVRRALVRQAVAWKTQQLEASGDRNPFAPDNTFADGVSEIERTLMTLCDAPGARHKLRTDCLFLDGKAVAVIIALVAGTRYSVFISAHAADDTSRFSPGTILLVKTMQLACRAGYRKFDLLAGDEGYKMDWCDGHIGLWDDVRGLTMKGKAAAPLGRLARHIKKTLKEHPRVLDVVKRANKLRSARNLI